MVAQNLLEALRLETAEKNGETTNYQWQNCDHCGEKWNANPWNIEALRKTPPRLCGQCSQQWEFCPKCGKLIPARHACDECASKAYLKRFKEQMPHLYGLTDRAALPCPEATNQALDEDQYLEEGKVGWYYYGPTGTGKTRTAYLVIERLISGGWHPAQILRGLQFAKDVPRLVMGEFGEIDRYINNLAKLEVLCFDEVDKFRLSERVESEWFDLFERRIEKHSLTILISNVNVGRFVERFSDQYREPVERRLKEFFIPIQFKKGKA